MTSLNEAYKRAIRSIERAGGDWEARKKNPAPEFFGLLDAAQRAIDDLLLMGHSQTARGHLEHSSRLMPKIIKAAGNGQEEPSIVDNLRNVHTILGLAQNSDIRPR